MPSLSSSSSFSFAARIVDWQRRAGRHDLPWQGSTDPYVIWLSEIMLQQTQVSTVIPYFERFLARFPQVQALALAPLDEVLALWAGLGYYARARNLHACACRIVNEYGGVFPPSAERLMQLPGIGRSTAAAIAAFAWGERSPILDGNVKRVLCRYFGIHGHPTGAVEKSLWQLAETLVPAAGEMGAYTQGLMDLGATTCLRRHPRCDVCPVKQGCVAAHEGLQACLPTPKPVKAKPEREAVFLLITDGVQVLLERRPPNGIWGGLLSLPEGVEALACLGLLDYPLQPLPERKHVFTHFQLRIRPLVCRVTQMPVFAGDAGGHSTSGLLSVPITQAEAQGVPAPVAQLLRDLELVCRQEG